MCRDIGTPESNRLMSIGLIALAIANVGNYILQRKHVVRESVADPLSGFLMGTAIAILLIAIYRRGRAQRSTVQRDP